MENQIKDLPKGQKRVYNLLNTGGCFSVYDICLRLHISDPRGHIASLRRKGIEILDEWRKCENGRYKVYFMQK